ncbi:hypothetical protein AB0E67_18870 [Streptomyces sp. NPDC032161]|uniref:hypothetical protein n=1 Tax=unclassified Streptomyces TaxID=2593676 RepID=UPI0033DAD3D5
MNVSPIRARTALAVGAALLLSGCAAPAEPAAGRTGAAAPSGHYTVTLDVVDDAGGKLTQTVEKRPGRGVVIGQALAELMIEFGLEDRIVGVGYLDNSYSAYAGRIEKLPKISDQLPSKESILERRPDLEGPPIEGPLIEKPPTEKPPTEESSIEEPPTEGFLSDEFLPEDAPCMDIPRKEHT